MPEHEGRALIDQLVAHATQRQFVYTHRWRVNDLVMWDNRCTMHRGTEFDDLRWKRDVQRATAMWRIPASRKASRSRPRKKISLARVTASPWQRCSNAEEVRRAGELDESCRNA
jgi:ribosomal protein L32